MSADTSQPTGRMFEDLYHELNIDSWEEQKPTPFDASRYSRKYLQQKYRERKLWRAYYEKHGRTLPFVPGVDDVLERIAMIHTPIARGLLLCEQVIIEEGTQRATLVNCYTRRAFSRFPTEPTNLVFVAFLADGMGEFPITLSIESLDDFEDVQTYSSVRNFDDPLQEYRAVFRVRNLSFPVPGAYQATLIADGEVLAQHRFELDHKEQP